MFKIWRLEVNYNGGVHQIHNFGGSSHPSLGQLEAWCFPSLSLSLSLSLSQCSEHIREEEKNNIKGSALPPLITCNLNTQKHDY